MLPLPPQEQMLACPLAQSKPLLCDVELPGAAQPVWGLCLKAGPNLRALVGGEKARADLASEVSWVRTPGGICNAGSSSVWL